MTSYAELYDKVAASLEADQGFTIQVQTARTKSGPETTWEVYVHYNNGTSILVEGATPDEVFRRFNAELNDEAESLEETSAAVGMAEVN